MSRRKLISTYKEQLYIDGYLNQQVKAGNEPEYGYKENHLPETKNQSREIKTMLALAKAK